MTEVLTGELVDPRVAEWAERVRPHLAKSVEGIIGAGRELAAAIDDLGPGRALDDLARELGMSKATISKFSAIAGNDALVSHGKRLPPAWTSLYELSQIPAAELEQAIDEGLVTPDLDRKGARALADTLVERKRREKETPLPLEDPSVAALEQLRAGLNHGVADVRHFAARLLAEAEASHDVAAGLAKDLAVAKWLAVQTRTDSVVSGDVQAVRRLAKDRLRSLLHGAITAAEAEEDVRIAINPGGFEAAQRRMREGLDRADEFDKVSDAAAASDGGAPDPPPAHPNLAAVPDLPDQPEFDVDGDGNDRGDVGDADATASPTDLGSGGPLTIKLTSTQEDVLVLLDIAADEDRRLRESNETGGDGVHWQPVKALEAAELLTIEPAGRWLTLTGFGAERAASIRRTRERAAAVAPLTDDGSRLPDADPGSPQGQAATDGQENDDAAVADGTTAGNVDPDPDGDGASGGAPSPDVAAAVDRLNEVFDNDAYDADLQGFAEQLLVDVEAGEMLPRVAMAALDLALVKAESTVTSPGEAGGGEESASPLPRRPKVEGYGNPKPLADYPKPSPSGLRRADVMSEVDALVADVLALTDRMRSARWEPFAATAGAAELEDARRRVEDLIGAAQEVRFMIGPVVKGGGG